VAETDRGREVAIVEFEHSGGDEIGVEAIGQGVDTYRGDYEPQHVGAVLAACTCENCETGSTPARNRYPDEDPASPHDRSQSPAFLFQSKFTWLSQSFIPFHRFAHWSDSLLQTLLRSTSHEPPGSPVDTLRCGFPQSYAAISGSALRFLNPTGAGASLESLPVHQVAPWHP